MSSATRVLSERENSSAQLYECVLLGLQVSVDASGLRRKQKLSMEISLTLDPIFVTKRPAAENALSASTEVGGRVRSALYIFSHVLAIL